MKSFSARGGMPIVQIAIIELAARRATITAADVSLALGLPKKVAIKKLDMMRMAGRLIRVKPGLYRAV